MPIYDWFKAREGRNYTTTSASAPGELPDGVWVKCPSCKHTLYKGDLDRVGDVCPHCGHHFDIDAPRRIALLVDEGTFEETEAGLTSVDPLRFNAAKPYTESLAKAREASGLPEGIITGRALICGHPVVLGVMDFRFIAGSMGSALGEKVARAFRLAGHERRAVVILTRSGGARMQEGMLSLMQMAKTAAEAERLARARLPYISVLANPTMGGVTASFATLADVIFAEPGALIGFAGQRVIEQTIRQSLPKNFRSAEYFEECGMVDAVVPRSELRERIGVVLDYLAGSSVADATESVARGIAAEGGDR
ncbi:MAG: acetyl-CoA carboxylase, carboxyltransferase subunit beta [Coriobacteriia bacterium]|nr:acetyl-CoA carboxylase, carboxyltransferase subunit beta [Coriobacteriia bacterium]